MAEKRLMGYKLTEDGKYQHREIYSEYYGIELTSTDIIHHVDSDINNNDISNLYKFSSTEAHMKYHWHVKKNGFIHPDEWLKIK